MPSWSRETRWERRFITAPAPVQSRPRQQWEAVWGAAPLYPAAGAGAEPPASAVVADLVDVTRMHTADPEHRVPHLAFQPDQLTAAPLLPMAAGETANNLRSPARGAPRAGRRRPRHPRAQPRRAPARRAGRHHAHPRRPRDLERRDDPEGAVRGRA